MAHKDPGPGGRDPLVTAEAVKSCTGIFHHAVTSRIEDYGRTGAACAYLEKHECLIVVGGDDSDGRVLDGMDIYKDDGTHYEGPPLSKPRERFGMTSSCVDRFVYCAGGKDKNGNALDTVEILTFGHKGRPVGVWHELDAKLNQARCDLALISHHNALFAVGGREQKGSVLCTVERLNTQAGGALWEVFPHLNVGRRDPILRVLSSEVLAVMGGYNNQGQLCCSAEVFDTHKSEWVFFPLPPPHSVARQESGCNLKPDIAPAPAPAPAPASRAPALAAQTPKLKAGHWPGKQGGAGPWSKDEGHSPTRDRPPAPPRTVSQGPEDFDRLQSAPTRSTPRRASQTSVGDPVHVSLRGQSPNPLRPPRNLTNPL